MGMKNKVYLNIHLEINYLECKIEKLYLYCFIESFRTEELSGVTKQSELNKLLCNFYYSSTISVSTTFELLIIMFSFFNLFSFY